jgi:hypothetical protein
VRELSKGPTSQITPRYNLPPLKIKTESGTVKEAAKLRKNVIEISATLMRRESVCVGRVGVRF